ncbi:MAG: hypothetical protein JWR90_458 [Marmoricola sp.]|jgi:hypothetical protein|nr:hypothetical protein [Marmoricola sp.]
MLSISSRHDDSVTGPEHYGVSVLIPTASVGPWLDESVNSVLAQDGVSLEVVVVHDGVEPDLSRAWAKDSRVRILETGVRGLSNALNVGAQACANEFIARLDADDRSLPGRLRMQAQFLDSHPEAVAVGTLAERINDQGKVTGDLGVVSEGDLRRRLLVRNQLMHPSVMFRASTWEESGGYDTQLFRMEDYELWLRMARLGELRVLPAPLIQYRVHEGQMSRAPSPASDFRIVLRARHALARHLGIGLVVQVALDGLFIVAHISRTLGLRKLGYLRNVSG